MPKVRIVIEAEINEETMQECGCSLEEVKNNIVLWDSDVIDGFELTTNISGLDNTSEFFLQNGKIIKTELRDDTVNLGRNNAMDFPSREEVESLRAEYPKGTRISLVKMDDPYSKLQPGDRGTVNFVDDAGNIDVSWDIGEGLSIAYGEDECRKLTQAELDNEAQEQETIREQAEEGQTFGMG